PHFCFLTICINHGDFHQQLIVFFIDLNVLDVPLVGGSNGFDCGNDLICRQAAIIVSHSGRCTNCQSQCCCERNNTTNRHMHTPVWQKGDPNTPHSKLSASF